MNQIHDAAQAASLENDEDLTECVEVIHRSGSRCRPPLHVQRLFLSPLPGAWLSSFWSRLRSSFCWSF